MLCTCMNSFQEVKKMTPILSEELVALAKAKEAEYEAKAKRARLLREAREPSGLRRELALLLYELAARLAPKVQTAPRHQHTQRSATGP
jgi:hypothetical protein